MTADVPEDGERKQRTSATPEDRKCQHQEPAENGERRKRIENRPYNVVAVMERSVLSRLGQEGVKEVLPQNPRLRQQAFPSRKVPPQHELVRIRNGRDQEPENRDGRQCQENKFPRSPSRPGDTPW